MVPTAAVAVSPPQRRAGVGVAIAAFSAATFGFGTTFARLAYDGGSNPLTIVLFRTGLFAVGIGLTLVVLGRFARLRRRALLGTVWMAITLAVVALGYQGSVAYIPVNLAALVFYSYPLLVGLIALASGRDRLTIGKAAALLTAFAGLALALGPDSGSLNWFGIGLALLAALGMALTVTFGGTATRDEDALLMSVHTSVWMLLFLAAAVVWSGGPALPRTGSGVIGTAGLCVTYVVAYVCWYTALGLVRPVRLAALFNIEPLVTLAVARIVLGETLTSIQLLGAALVLGSVLSMSFEKADAKRVA